MNGITFLTMFSLVLSTFLMLGCGEPVRQVEKVEPGRQVEKVEPDRPADNVETDQQAEKVEPDRSAGIVGTESSVAPGAESYWREYPPEDLEVDEHPVPVNRVEPEYPEAARRNKIEGTVWIRVLVNADGTVETAEIDKSDDPEFDDVTLHAITQWKFKPAMKDGKAVVAWVRIPVKFKLEK